MKKLKKLSDSMVSYSIHGMDDDHKDYLDAMNEYKNSDAKNRKENVPIKKGYRFTLSAVLDMNEKIGYVGLSICSPCDNFIKKAGRDISISKAIVYKNKFEQIVSGDPIAYFTISNSNMSSYEIKREILDHLLNLRTLISDNVDDYFTRNLSQLINLNEYGF